MLIALLNTTSKITSAKSVKLLPINVFAVPIKIHKCAYNALWVIISNQMQVNHVSYVPMDASTVRVKLFVKSVIKDSF